MQHRTSGFLADDRGDYLVENMIAVLIVGASLLAGLAGFTVMAHSTLANIHNLNLTTNVNNHLESLLASQKHPALGTSQGADFGDTTGIVWSQLEPGTTNVPVTRVFITVPLSGAHPSDCTINNSHPDCLTVTATSMESTGANARTLSTTSNRAGDQYTVTVPANAKAVYYAIQAPGTSTLTSLVITNYNTGTIDTATQAGAKGWNNGRVELVPADGTTTIGFKATGFTLNPTNIVVLTQGSS